MFLLSLRNLYALYRSVTAVSLLLCKDYVLVELSPLTRSKDCNFSTDCQGKKFGGLIFLEVTN